MNHRLTSPRATAIGTTVLMACACGAGANSAKLLRMGGFDITSKITHSLLLGIGAVLVMWGLYGMRRVSGFLAMAGFATLVTASALTPPMAMSVSRLPWNALQVAGGLLYLVFAVALVYAYWTAFPSPRPAASATALGGTALATGCNCCMVTGAVAGLAVTAGGDPAIFMKQPLVFFSGVVIAGFGLARIRGFRPLPWLVAGALITRFGGEALKPLGDWWVGDVNLRFIPGYAMYLIGAGLVVKAWAVAYEPVQTDETTPVPIAEPAAV